MIQPGPDGFQVGGVHIEGRPRFPWRGLMLDVCRHWMPVEMIEQNLDAMAAVKLNVLHGIFPRTRASAWRASAIRASTNSLQRATQKRSAIAVVRGQMRESTLSCPTSLAHMQASPP